MLAQVPSAGGRIRRVGQRLAVLGPIQAKFGQLRPTSVRCGPNMAKIWTQSAEVRPLSLDPPKRVILLAWYQIWPKVDPLVEFGRRRLELDPKMPPRELSQHFLGSLPASVPRPVPVSNSASMLRACFEHSHSFCPAARPGRNLASIVLGHLLARRPPRAAAALFQHMLCTFRSVGIWGVAAGFWRHSVAQTILFAVAVPKQVPPKNAPT